MASGKLLNTCLTFLSDNIYFTEIFVRINEILYMNAPWTSNTQRRQTPISNFKGFNYPSIFAAPPCWAHADPLTIQLLDATQDLTQVRAKPADLEEAGWKTMLPGHHHPQASVMVTMVRELHRKGQGSGDLALHTWLLKACKPEDRQPSSVSNCPAPTRARSSLCGELALASLTVLLADAQMWCLVVYGANWPATVQL